MKRTSRTGKPLPSIAAWFGLIASSGLYLRVSSTMFSNLFRSRPKHIPLPQHDAERLDSDTLLPPPAASSMALKKTALDRSSRDVQVAAKTLVLCTIVYLGAALWIGYSFKKTTFVADADEFCLHHVSLYCECEANAARVMANPRSAGCQKREAKLAYAAVQRELSARERLSAIGRTSC